METDTYSQIILSVKQLLGIDLHAYKDQQMRRRLDSWLIRCGAQDWNTYFKRLKGDTSELSRFRDYLTINVSEFFRDNDRWQALRNDILPGLSSAALRLRPIKGGIKVWSAGCSIGAEPYTLAILLNECAPAQDHTILATDLDRGILQRARGRGPYTREDVRNVSAARMEEYFEPGGPPFFFKERYARRIQFREHNLLQDPFDKQFDLIVCRNVIIYFTNEAKQILYQKFCGALRPGGILFLGGTEIIPRPMDIGLKNQGISFYVKAG